MKEIWKKLKYKKILPIYEISNYGRMRKIDSKKELKLSKANNGYWLINLKTSKGWRTYYIHTLVISTFKLFKVKNKNTCNHIDGNKDNNKSSNLEWANHTEQRLHAYKLGLREKIYIEDEIHQICKLLEQGKKRKEIQKILNIENTKSFKSLIENIKSKNSWYHISKDYDIFDNKKAGNFKYDESIIHNICKLISEGYDKKDIAIILNLEYNKSFRDLVYLIKTRKTWKHISVNYDW